MVRTAAATLLTIVLPLALSLAQVPKPGSAPALPLYDWDKHPGEHCAYTRWTASQPVTVYNTAKSDHQVIGHIAQGDSVLGIKGVMITFQPGIIRMDRDLPQHHLKRGDTILTYAYRGEGFSAVWFAGVYYPDFDISFAKYPDGGGCGGARCAATVVTRSRTEWWAQVQINSGLTAWVNATPANFSGICRQ